MHVLLDGFKCAKTLRSKSQCKLNQECTRAGGQGECQDGGAEWDEAQAGELVRHLACACDCLFKESPTSLEQVSQSSAESCPHCPFQPVALPNGLR